MTATKQADRPRAFPEFEPTGTTGCAAPPKQNDSRSRIVSFLIYAPLSLWTGAGQPAPLQLAPPVIAYTGVAARAPSDTSTPDTVPQRLRGLKARSGLAWTQIAELFGVTRRAVYFWLDGGAMSDENAQRIEVLESAINRAPGSNPRAVRAALLTPDEQGLSPYATMLDAVLPKIERRQAPTGDLPKPTDRYIPSPSLGVETVDPDLFRR